MSDYFCIDFGALIGAIVIAFVIWHKPIELHSESSTTITGGTVLSDFLINMSSDYGPPAIRIESDVTEWLQPQWARLDDEVMAP